MGGLPGNFGAVSMPLPSPLFPPPLLLPPAPPLLSDFGPLPPFAPPGGRFLALGGRFSCEITEIACIFAPFLRVLAPEFYPKSPPFSVISHLFFVISRPCSLGAPAVTALTREPGQTAARVVGTTAKKAVVAGDVGQKRCDETRSEGAGATASKCESTGNASSHDGGGDGATSPPSPARPASQFPPRYSRLASFSPPVPPLLSDFWPSSPLRPDRRALPPAGGGIFRARLRKLLAFSPHFSVLSHPIFAAKSPCFP